MNCPLCEKPLTIDVRNKWILCSSNKHKFKLTDWDDTTLKSVTRKMCSDSVIQLKGMLGQEGIDKTNTDLLNGQLHAYEMLADFLIDDDFRDYE